MAKPKMKKSRKKSPNTNTTTPAPNRAPPSDATVAPASPPRLDPYLRLTARFYEVLFTLVALGPVRGDHIRAPEPSDPAVFLLRRLKDNLAYVCDLRKGGETSASVAIENTPDYYIFWMSINHNNERDRAAYNVLAFLKNLLALLKEMVNRLKKCQGLNGAQEKKEQDSLAEFCIKNCKKRVKKEASCLKRAILKAKHDMKRLPGKNDTEMIEWLNQFAEQDDILKLCRLAYDERHSSLMNRAKAKVSDYNLTESDDDPDSSPWNNIYHYIGRLSRHVSAAKWIVQDAIAQDHLFSNYEVSLVPSLPQPQRPEADEKTTLEGILTRMLPKGEDDPDWDTYLKSFRVMDSRYKIMTKIKDCYSAENKFSGVHSEIYMLEHFYSNKLEYELNDKYIGCSKPSCQSCYLYMKHHPARVVLPRSHQKVWHQWGPPPLPGGAQDPNYIHQRDILNLVNHDMREDAKEQIMQKGAPRQKQHDSTTGITNLENLKFASLSLEDDRGYFSDTDVTFDWSDIAERGDEEEESSEDDDDDDTHQDTAKGSILIGPASPSYSQASMTSVSPVEESEESSDEDSEDDRGGTKLVPYK